MATHQSASNGEQFPVAHLRSHLDEQFSFRSDTSLMSSSNNGEMDTPANGGLQSIVANEAWYQVSLYRFVLLPIAKSLGILGSLIL